MFFIIILNFIVMIHSTSSLLCYNGTFTYRHYGEDPVTYRGLFGPSSAAIAKIRCLLTTKCDICSDQAMCFVRSWTARARHAWIVQRGCYQSSVDDTLPRSMTIPTRAMTCKHERLPEAEYKVCLCQADWCNSASSINLSVIHNLLMWCIYIIGALFFSGK